MEVLESQSPRPGSSTGKVTAGTDFGGQLKVNVVRSYGTYAALTHDDDMGAFKAGVWFDYQHGPRYNYFLDYNVAHAQAIGLFEESQHPSAGRLRQPRHPTQFLRTPARFGGPAPTLGEHTDEILAEVGWADRQPTLRRDGIVA